MTGMGATAVIDSEGGVRAGGYSGEMSDAVLGGKSSRREAEEGGCGSVARAAGDGIGGTFRALATTGVTAGPPRVQQKALSPGIGGGSSGVGGGCSSGGWTSSGGNGEATSGSGVESEHGADASETRDGQRSAGNSGVQATASGIAGSSDGACGMSRDCRASGASLRAAVEKLVAGAATGDLVGCGRSDSAASGEASAGGKSCRATEARRGDKGFDTGAGRIEGEHGAGVGVCGRRTWTGDSGAVAGDSCGKTGASGIFGRVDNSRASSVARGSVRAGAGGWGDKGVIGAASEGSEACRGAAMAWPSC